MPSHYLDSLKAKFAELRPDDANKLKPCSEVDISNLESQLSIRLPLAYREYLLWVGKGVNFLGFTRHTYYALKNVRPYLREVFADIEPTPRLPDDAFVFATDVSPMFYFFRIDGEDNPKVYLFIEPGLKKYFQDAPQKTWPPAWQFLYDDRAKKDFHEFAPSFTDFLNIEMDTYIQSMQRREAWRASHRQS